MTSNEIFIRSSKGLLIYLITSQHLHTYVFNERLYLLLFLLMVTII
jgi:hypothetical protein